MLLRLESHSWKRNQSFQRERCQGDTLFPRETGHSSPRGRKGGGRLRPPLSATRHRCSGGSVHGSLLGWLVPAVQCCRRRWHRSYRLFLLCLFFYPKSMFSIWGKGCLGSASSQADVELLSGLPETSLSSLHHAPRPSAASDAAAGLLGAFMGVT